jgi:predicted lipoprotein with Yx(FWY)xxD motif
VRRTAAALTAVLGMVLVTLTACGGSAASGRPSKDADVTLSVSSTPTLGKFIVTDGWTLYMYPPDRQKAVTCTKVDECTQAWPPLYVSAGRHIIAGPGVKSDLIGSMAGDGGQVVTYNHWPLYYYIGDRKPGVVNGQNQGFNWFVIAPDGVPTKTAGS